MTQSFQAACRANAVQIAGGPSERTRCSSWAASRWGRRATQANSLDPGYSRGQGHHLAARGRFPTGSGFRNEALRAGGDTGRGVQPVGDRPRDTTADKLSREHRRRDRRAEQHQRHRSALRLWHIARDLDAERADQADEDP